MKKLVSLVLLVASIFAIDTLAAYPSKTIKLIVPSKAGGSTDTTARLFVETAKKYWKDADFIVVDKPGSGGLMGFEAEARARADGYTIGLMFTPQLVAHIVAKRASYTLDSFKIIGNVAEDPEIIVVSAKSKIKNIADLIKAAKSKRFTVAVNGIGSDDFLAAKNFESIEGVTFNLMPTKGSTEQKAAILGNHVDAAFMNLSQMLSQHKAGKARIIAILSKKRSSVAPDIKTGLEQNYSGLMTATRGIVIGAKVKKSIADKITDLYTKVVNDPSFQEKCAKSYIFLNLMNGAEYKAYLESLQKTTQKVYDATPW
ncbi:tripartite tricarboxylate transporter substrate binding protein [Sulfurospirillum sp. 1612]|uniref:tripartite tricarboxylate transporter substrate binding protein n=1 Tax=Sulfurospirillum sp. 1612 TaxID=3094835 RepID=UPI002F93BA69